MSEINWHRLRGIIITSVSAGKKGYDFDTDKALGNGYTEDEIGEADKILLSNEWLSDKFLQIRNDFYSYSPMAEKNLYICYIEAVRLILLISNDFECTSMFEEDLIVDVAKKKAYVAHLEYVEHKYSHGELHPNPSTN